VNGENQIFYEKFSSHSLNSECLSVLFIILSLTSARDAVGFNATTRPIYPRKRDSAPIV